MSCELESRPLKRCRDEFECVEEEICRHSSMYYANGDIVILSLPKHHVVTAFKVDKVLLARHSPVFEGMLSLPSPSDVEKYDDAPLVRLQDTAEELASFLAALYDATVIPFAKHNPDTVKEVEKILKLSTKYQVDRLRERIVALLSKDWPSTLAAWDSNEIEIGAIKKTYEFACYEGTETVDDVLPEPCAVIRLARDHGIQEILPAAFYHLSRIPTFADVDVDHPSEEYSEYVYKKGRSAKFSLLSREDLMCLLRGIREILVTAKSLAKYAQQMTVLQCASKCRPTCTAAMATFIDTLHCGSDDNEYCLYGVSDPLDKFLCKGFVSQERLCLSCRFQFPMRMMEARRELWDSLPTIFGLAEVE